MPLSLLDAYVSVVGFPSGLHKAIDSTARWLLVLCVTLMLVALCLGGYGVFLTFVQVTHDRRVSTVAAALAVFVLRAMTRLVVTGTLIPLHYPAPGQAPSDEPVWLWLELFGRRPESTTDYRPPVAPTILLSMITALAAHPVAPLCVSRIFSADRPKYVDTLAPAALFIVVFSCFAARHALYTRLYPYLEVIWSGEVSVIKQHLAYRELVIARLLSSHGDAVIGHSERLAFESITQLLRRELRQRAEKERLGVKATVADGSRWTDLFEHWTELRYLFVAPAPVSLQHTAPRASIQDDGERARAVVR